MLVIQLQLSHKILCILIADSFTCHVLIHVISYHVFKAYMPQILSPTQPTCVTFHSKPCLMSPIPNILHYNLHRYHSMTENTPQSLIFNILVYAM